MPPIRQSDPGAFNQRNRRAVLAALERVVDSGWYILGSEVAGFEKEMAELFGFNEAIGVANGTDAVHLSLRALGVGAGSRVVTVSHTAVATVAAIEMAGATPVFVDIDARSYTMDPDALAALVLGGEPIDAIVAVHLYGQPADMERIRQIANRTGAALVEDCAQAHGARIGTQFVGSLGDAAAFSFYPTKNLGAIGDGGLVATRDAQAADRVRSLREYGWRSRYVSECSGVNSRLDEIQAAYLRLRLPLLEQGNRRRAEIAAMYDQGLGSSGLVLPVRRPGTTHVFHQYVVRHSDRDGLRSRLLERGIATNIHYPVPVHCQPAYRERSVWGPGGLDATESAAREVLSLPMYPELADALVEEVIDAVKSLA